MNLRDKEISNNVLEKLKNRALSGAVNRGMKREEAEDFSLWCVEKILNGKRDIKVPIRWLYVDYLRECFGRSGSKFNKSRRELQVPMIQDVNRGPMCQINEDRICYNKIIKSLIGIDRAILVLNTKWGFTYNEIGECFGLTQARIQQIMAKIKDKIRKTLKKE